VDGDPTDPAGRSDLAVLIALDRRPPVAAVRVPPMSPRRVVATCVLLVAVTACSSSDPPGGATSATTTADFAVVPSDTGPVASAPTSLPAPMELTTDGVPTRPTVTPQAGDSLLGPLLATSDNPIDVVERPGSGELFVLERLGTVRRLVDGLLTDPVLDLRSTLTPELEWGLLGLAFAPDGSSAYVNETDGFETRIHEFPVGSDGGFDTPAGRIVYRFDQPADGHNGGDLAFGPDGMLYVFNGDGGGDRDDEEIGGAWNSDIYRRALSLASPLGKVLRIDPTPSDDAPFTIPPDNPFVDVDGALGEIWSVGLRNPWRNAFDPATGDLWIADVGNFAWEEISRAVAGPDGAMAGRGVSFGWSAWEGFERANEDQAPAGHLVPVYEYAHGELGCSVVGGPVYRGARFPDLDGRYLFGDHCSGLVWALTLDETGAVDDVRSIATLPFLVDITSTTDGRIIVTSIVEGIHELEPAS